MRPLLVAVIAIIVTACAPTPTNVNLPPEAGRFARLVLPIEPDIALVNARNLIDNGIDKFLLSGLFADGTGFQTYWAAVGGQAVTVYFRFEKNPSGGTLVRILTLPTPPPTAERLAKGINEIAQRLKDQLGFQTYTFEPDR
jgi:hypothetical protein